MEDVHVDVLIVGAGLSGIAAGYYLQSRLPKKTYAILEARDDLGGTWDLFRYPGVRSDSDMHTLGYSFAPWLGDVALAGGSSIKQYVARTARDFGIEPHIRFGHRVTRASWSPADARWTLEASAAGKSVRYLAPFVYFCSGYYDYANGYLPQWPQMEAYGGEIVHPQAWPPELDVAGKRVLVIGSGATAVTIVPALAQSAREVTMLQRSPTYIVSLPSRDPVARALYRVLPARAVHPLVRWKNVLMQLLFYTFMRKRPQQTKKRIKELTREALGEDFDLETHFTPRYDPWDQRLCFVPDGDFFEALRSKRASIVTGTIERFTPDGVRLASGEELKADIVVTATGLNFKLFGGTAIDIDGAPLDVARRVSYKGMMLCGVPNLALAIGYTNASWTLKCELTARYVCRLLDYMDRHGFRTCVPEPPGADVEREPAISFTSGYIVRAAAEMPKQGARVPWRLHQNYVLDLAALRFGRVNDGVMEFLP